MSEDFVQTGKTVGYTVVIDKKYTTLWINEAEDGLYYLTQGLCCFTTRKVYIYLKDITLLSCIGSIVGIIDKNGKHLRINCANESLAILLHEFIFSKCRI